MMQQNLKQLREGFSPLPVDEATKEGALEFLGRWLTDQAFAPYRKQIIWVTENQHHELLLDSFYQVLPFGTGGRRGPVGIGPNRMNPWTVATSAQGHANFLKNLGVRAEERGVVIGYDCRVFQGLDAFNPDIADPIQGITSEDFALIAAAVYLGNGIPVHFFDIPRTTPEFAFGIIECGASGGIIITASHNPAGDNGKKVYNEHGGQLIPPEDEELLKAVDEVASVTSVPLDEVRGHSQFTLISGEVNKRFVSVLVGRGLGSDSKINKDNVEDEAAATPEPKKLGIVYSPLHGVGATSVIPVLEAAGFTPVLDPATATQDGSFPNVKFNIPNPEVPEALETAIEHAENAGAKLVIATDPDADRVGFAVKHQDEWHTLNGHEIGVILLVKKIQEAVAKKEDLTKKVIAKTEVTTSLITKVAEEYGIHLEGNLMTGFKYIGNVVRRLIEAGRGKDFLIGIEDSFGYLTSPYIQDKDGAGAALAFANLFEELLKEDKTPVDALNEIQAKHGVHINTLPSIVMEGTAGRKNILKIMDSLRANPPKQMGEFEVKSVTDFWESGDFVSKTDKSSRNLLVFHFESTPEAASARIGIRPSGTEPKIKIFTEISGHPLGTETTEEDLAKQKQELEEAEVKLKAGYMRAIYDILDIDMPKHAYHLSSLLSIEARIHYMKHEEDILETKRRLDAGEASKEELQEELDVFLAPFGRDPIEKISLAFKAKHGQSFKEFFGL